MNLLKLRYFPDPFLLKPSKKVNMVKDNHIRTAIRMYKLMKELKGFGLAAPQVGVEYALIIIDTTTKPHGVKRTMYNPEIIGSSDEIFDYEEGCLSSPGEYINKKRSAGITVKYINSQNEEIIENFREITAVCIQHEIDHLEGKPFIILDNETQNV